MLSHVSPQHFFKTLDRIGEKICPLSFLIKLFNYTNLQDFVVG